jgi:LmbE family N-acetylglucosaminyl deacetylase
MAAGVIYQAKLDGDKVHVVVLSNGDSQGKNVGYVRENETISAMSVLGLNEQEVIFFGYGDGTLFTLYESSNGHTVVTSKAGQKNTYGNRGLGHADFHTLLHGKPGEYNRETIIADLEALLKKIAPDDIYTTSFYDDHPDHRATYGLLVAALIDVIRSGSPIRPRIHETLIHAPGSCPGGVNCGSGGWPRPVFTPRDPFPEPNLRYVPFRWDEIENVPVPAAMQDPDPNHNLKYRAIAAYISQAPPPGHSNWLQAFVKKNEFFWVHDFGANLAPSADISASSENVQSGQSARSATDGVIAGEPLWPAGEWVAQTDGPSPWLNLSWKKPTTISHVMLYDRPSLSENILAGTLLLSDGSHISIPALPEDGAGLLLEFASRRVTWIKLQIDRAEGKNPGLAEIEVFGFMAPSSGIFPQITRGPSPTSANITSKTSVALEVDAFDAQAKPLRFNWSSDMGSISGNGPKAMFRAPQVASDCVATITVTIAGERGTVHNSTFVKVAKPGSWVRRVWSRLILSLKWLWHFFRNRLWKAL